MSASLEVTDDIDIQNRK